MTYKAYIDNIKLQTGKTPEDFVELAKKKGFIINGKTVAKHGEMLAWLKTEMGFRSRACKCDHPVHEISRDRQTEATGRC